MIMKSFTKCQRMKEENPTKTKNKSVQTKDQDLKQRHIQTFSNFLPSNQFKCYLTCLVVLHPAVICIHPSKSAVVKVNNVIIKF